jgi:hypothetical protein
MALRFSASPQRWPLISLFVLFFALLESLHV